MGTQIWRKAVSGTTARAGVNVIQTDSTASFVRTHPDSFPYALLVETPTARFPRILAPGR